MSRQTSINNFFKCKQNSEKVKNVTLNNEKQMKRPSLSLIRSTTPAKSPKHEIGVGEQPASIDLSDDEIFSAPKLVIPQVDLTQSSTDDTPVESDTSECTINYSLSPATPQKLITPTSKSPGSRNKYFSPNKKRSIAKRNPIKKNLSKLFESDVAVKDDVFTKACNGMDDKTILFLTMINKYLNDESLRHLLDEASQELLSQCLHLVKPGLRLVCRLYWRKHGWYRRMQIKQISSNGKDILDDPSVDVMLNSLIENNLIETNTLRDIMTFEDYTTVLKSTEIKQICKDLKLKIQSKKDAVQALRNFSRRTSISKYFTGDTSNNWNRILKILNQKAGSCYKLTDMARNTLYKLYLLMFLGIDYNLIREKKLELALIFDKIKTEVYPVDKNMGVDNASVVFKTKEQFDKYFNAHLVYEDFLTRTDVRERCQIVKQVYNWFQEIEKDDMIRYISLPSWLCKFTPAYLYIKILEIGVQDLKRDKTKDSYTLALEILSTLLSQIAFRQHKRPEWYSEKAHILHSLLKKHDEAATVLIEGFQSSMSNEAKDIMRPRARKIANQINILLAEHLERELLEYANKDNKLEANLTAEHVYKQPMETKRGKLKFETRTSEGRLVQDAEEFCITHYICNGGFTHGEHWEGRIVTSIFFLLFWNIIYSKPPGVYGIFLTNYQLYPLDMFTESFYINRKALIDDWLLAIEHSNEERLIDIMSETWSKRSECELSGINRSIGWENIRWVATCLGPAGLAAICRRLARNYHYTHSGFPDLTLWNVNTKQIKFVEVKTDSDKPSIKQIQWMHYLRENNIDTEFCYVGANTMRVKSRPGKKTGKSVIC